MPLPLHAFYCLLLILISPITLAENIIHHDFKITLQPSKGEIKVKDTIFLPQETTEVTFKLHQNLTITSSPDATITSIDAYDNKTSTPVQYYQAKFSQPKTKFNLHYSGVITHSLQQISTDYAGEQIQTQGLITPKGVYLSAASYWFPRMDSEYLTFSIQAKLPEGWQFISQGGAIKNGWEEQSPQKNIYIIAAPYRLYQRKTPIAKAMVYLRSEDPVTANNYLDATERYLALYSKLLGSYPYAKFALVENFWETGYGMPSFTLLGPTVIRLPFIIHTSYPHEILHNWWGNGVYPDYTSGNWSEGLTSYLADHLLQEQRGMGADYRRTTLQRYADSVQQQKEFPLTAFQSRHGQASQAIGYGKTMMFFHMLRQQLGDETFIRGLRYFYKNNLFKVAGFDDLQHAFEYTSKKKLGTEFKQWTTRTGAPALQLSNVSVEKTTDGFNINATLKQIQTDPAFKIAIPILIQLEGKKEYINHIFYMDKKEALLKLTFNSPPLEIKVDPQFDLFRQLDPSEIPSSFAQLFSANDAIIILPSDAPNKIKIGYKKLADDWVKRSPTLKIMWDSEIANLPKNRAIWLLGQHNKFLNVIDRSTKTALFHNESTQLTLNKKSFSKKDHSFAVTTPNPSNSRETIGWISASSASVISRISRKLSHYKKYSYLVFEGDKARNVLKGRWPLSESALNISISKNKARAALPLTAKPPLTHIITIINNS